MATIDGGGSNVLCFNTGEGLVLNTSATNIIALVCSAALEEALPIKVTIRDDTAACGSPLPSERQKRYE